MSRCIMLLLLFLKFSSLTFVAALPMLRSDGLSIDLNEPCSEGGEVVESYSYPSISEQAETSAADATGRVAGHYDRSFHIAPIHSGSVLQFVHAPISASTMSPASSTHTRPSMDNLFRRPREQPLTAQASKGMRTVWYMGLTGPQRECFNGMMNRIIHERGSTHHGQKKKLFGRFTPQFKAQAFTAFILGDQNWTNHLLDAYFREYPIRPYTRQTPVEITIDEEEEHDGPAATEEDEDVRAVRRKGKEHVT